MLGRVVPGAVGREDPTAHRRNVDDSARALRPHVRQDELGEVREAEQVDLELVSRVVERDVLDGSIEAEARVVDQNVNPSFRFDDAAHGPLVVLALRDVHLDRGDAVFGQVVHAVRPASAGVDGVAPAGQQDRGFPAHAGGCSRDEYDLSQVAALSLRLAVIDQSTAVLGGRAAFVVATRPRVKGRRA